MKVHYKNRLFVKTFILIFLAIFIIFSTFGIYSYFEKKSSLLNMLRIEAMNIAKSISLVSSDALVLDDDPFLVELNSDYIKQSDRIKNIIISKKDSTYLIIEKTHWQYTDKIDEQIKNAQHSTDTFDFFISPILHVKVFHYTYPIYLSGLQWGWLHISLDIKEYNKNIKELYYQYLYLFVGIVFISMLCSFLIAKLFSKPIVSLNSVAKEIAAGDLSKRVEFQRNDEIGELADTFNKMMRNLEKSKNELTQSHTILEYRVKDRTKELKNMNVQLEELNDSLDMRVKMEINKRKEQEQILIQQSRLAAMGEMISMIAHQWRQPLNALSIIIQNLHLEYNSGGLTHESVEYSMKKSVALTQKMSNTIDDFKDFFKPNKIKKDFYLHMVVSQTIDLVKDSFVNNSIQIEYKIQKEISVYGFENELSQVLLNILTNAKDALIDNNIEEGFIEISIKKENNYGKIYIQDNAGGIKKEILDKIFEPYFTTKDEKNGTGLGLYMSKIIIEQNMHGKLSVKNIDLGSQFCIAIPLQE